MKWDSATLHPISSPTNIHLNAICLLFSEVKIRKASCNNFEKEVDKLPDELYNLT
ncbi:MAG: hypothetical protein QME81_08450 [bacterium]|nr:hypothetical protein [bacterium]